MAEKIFKIRPVDPLNHDVPIVTPQGWPTPQFMRQWVQAREINLSVDEELGNKSDVEHEHDAADIVSGTFSDALISQSSVTQHQAALAIGWGQLTGVPATFPPSAHSHLAADLPATIAYTNQGNVFLGFSQVFSVTNPADAALGVLVTGNPQYSWYVTASGELAWGSGAVGADTALFRSAVGMLRLNDYLHVNKGIGIGTAPTTNNALCVVGVNLLSDVQVACLFSLQASAVGTTMMIGNWAAVASHASAYTVASARIFYASPAVKGAGSTITSLVGLYLADQTVGTNNYAIYTEQSVGYAIYTAGGAAVVFSGPTTVSSTLNVTGHTALTTFVAIYGSIGSTAATNVRLYVSGTSSASTGTTQYGIISNHQFTASATDSVFAIYGHVVTAAGSYSANAAYGLYIESATKGAGTTLFSNYGIRVMDQTAGNVNYGIHIGQVAGWALYAPGGGASYFGGYLQLIGTLYFGTALDSYIYRSAANTLRTDATFHIASGGMLLGIGGSTSSVIDAGDGAALLIRYIGDGYMYLDASTGIKFRVNGDSAQTLAMEITDGGSITMGVVGGAQGFFGSAGGTRPVIAGSRGANAALASLITGLASLNLLSDTTTA